MKESKRQTVTAATTERLREMIIGGDLIAGETLRQDDLSARLDVSRTPLREAIITLQAEGLVVAHPHKGAIVYKPTADELQNIYEIRILLETEAARQATLKMTPERRAAIEAIISRMDAESSPWELIRLNHEFREAFYATAGNPLLVEVIRRLMMRADPYVGMLAGSALHPFAASEFEDLLGAVRNCDAEGAASATRAHLEATVDKVLPMLRR